MWKSLQKLDAFIRVRAITNDIAQTPHEVIILTWLPRVFQNSLKGGQVGMYIGDDQIAHSGYFHSFLRQPHIVIPPYRQSDDLTTGARDAPNARKAYSPYDQAVPVTSGATFLIAPCPRPPAPA